MKTKFSTTQTVAIVLVMSIISTAGLYYYRAHRISSITDSRAVAYTGIDTYQEACDWPFIQRLFDTQWFWLVAQSRSEYDPTFHFKHRTWSNNPHHFGKLTIKVYRENNNPAGFIAYYKKSTTEGYIWYLAVDPAYRGKGYAQALVQHALGDLRAQGCQVIRLVTRLINTPARAVYTKTGFVQTHADDTFVYYAYRSIEI